jgi:hypothetical protein
MVGSKGRRGNRHKRKNPGGKIRTHGERIILTFILSTRRSKHD